MLFIIHGVRFYAYVKLNKINDKTTTTTTIQINESSQLFANVLFLFLFFSNVCNLCIEIVIVVVLFNNNNMMIK